MNAEEKYDRIVRGLAEVVGAEKIKEILKTRDLKIYWGTAPTGRPHLAYFIPLLKIRDFLEAGCEVTVLLADIHAFLDNMKSSFESIGDRAAYYKKIITAILSSLSVDLTKVKFRTGTEFQRSREYALDVYKMASITPIKDAQKAGTEVVKNTDNPMLSSLMYPNMQALDEEYLGVDVQFGGVDQRKIFMHAKTYMPRLGYGERAYLMNRMMPGLAGGKMCSSDEFSKIDLVDTKEAIAQKIKKCFCEEGNINSGVLYMFEFVIFDVLPDDIVVNGKKYNSYEELKNDFAEKKIHPADLKAAAAGLIERIIQPVRDTMLQDKDLLEKAYGSINARSK